MLAKIKLARINKTEWDDVAKLSNLLMWTFPEITRHLKYLNKKFEIIEVYRKYGYINKIIKLWFHFIWWWWIHTRLYICIYRNICAPSFDQIATTLNCLKYFFYPFLNSAEINDFFWGNRAQNIGNKFCKLKLA